MKWPLSVIASIAVGLFVVSSVPAAEKQTVVVVRGATIVAFFPPTTQAELKNDPDTNEALADFQYYATNVQKPLHDEGIDFKEIYARSFRLEIGTSSTTFRPGKVKIGYYFVAPSKKPRVEYGVMTDHDLLQIATEYFGLAAR
jgi:hypothetical protein